MRLNHLTGLFAADLSTPGAAAKLLSAEPPDAIVHLAGIPDADAEFEQLLPANILSITWLLEAAAATTCRRFVFASSAQTIEGYPVDVQISPGMAVAPANLYASPNATARRSVLFMPLNMACHLSRSGSAPLKPDMRMRSTMPATTAPGLSPEDA